MDSVSGNARNFLERRHIGWSLYFIFVAQTSMKYSRKKTVIGLDVNYFTVSNKFTRFQSNLGLNVIIFNFAPNFVGLIVLL